MHLNLKQYLHTSRKIIQLNDIDVDICLAFAEAVYETNKIEYSRRNQSDKKTIIRQIVSGKMAELGIYEYLKELNLSPEFPDFKIYGKNKKSFDADIKFIYQKYNIRCHVKSQDINQGRIYSPSWLFQKKRDPLVKKPLEYKNDLLAFVRLSDLKAEMLGFIWAPEAAPYYSKPRLEYLQDNKSVLYLDDLKKAGLL